GRVGATARATLFFPRTRVPTNPRTHEPNNPTTMNTFDPDAAALSGSGIYGLPFTPEESRVVIIPVPFEATTSYGGGTSHGPAAVLEASRQVDLFDRETGKPYEQGIAMLPISRKLVRWNAEARAMAQPVIEKGGVVDRK